MYDQKYDNFIIFSYIMFKNDSLYLDKNTFIYYYIIIIESKLLMMII